ncbi:MAG: peptidoglycan DD-metalloendopeptidase family protein, partial [Desulfocucumaceae bacterium]
KDNSLYLGEKRIIAQGKSGKREVTYNIVSVNGIEKDRVIVDEVMLEQSQPKVVATGTKALLASRGSSGGRLTWPSVGSVISPYGRRGGRLHSGVDINSSSGSPVKAAQSGTVIRAGWYSGYGKCVEVSHGDGIVTRYGHLSSIAVNVGQKVSAGEFIGRVGATGRATGPHLHFEVLVGGSARNPMNYF